MLGPRDIRSEILRATGRPEPVPAGEPEPRQEPREVAVYVWLAEKAYGGPADVLGIYSTSAGAKKVCQDSANEYFGERSTPPLHWTGDERFCSASYHHPCTGMWLFTVTRYVVDEEQEGKE